MPPAGPTNGRPCKSSLSPGCSPTIITRAAGLPSPKTVCVPSFHRSQALHPAAAVRRAGSVSLSGMGAADTRVGRWAMLFLMRRRQGWAASLTVSSSYKWLGKTRSKAGYGMKFHTEYLTFNTKKHREYIHITPQEEKIVHASGVTNGMALISAMHITAGGYVNDDHLGLIQDIHKWLEQLALFNKPYL